jgi:hypothetical protein
MGQDATRPHLARARSVREWFLLVCSLLTGCGADSSPLDTAFSAVQAKDPSRAIALIAPYRASLDVTGEAYRDATLLYCEALALTDPDEVLPTIVSLAEVQTSALTPRDWDHVVVQLQQARLFEHAVRLTHEGLARWPADERLTKRIDELRRIAANGANEGLSATLRGLGYLSE